MAIPLELDTKTGYMSCVFMARTYWRSFSKPCKISSYRKSRRVPALCNKLWISRQTI